MVTPGHSRTVRVIDSQDIYGFGQTFIDLFSHMYIGFVYWADYRGRDTKHSFTLIMGERNNIVYILEINCILVH